MGREAGGEEEDAAEIYAESGAAVVQARKGAGEGVGRIKETP